MSQKVTKFVLKKHLRIHEIAPFFFLKFPDTPSLAPWEVNFAAPIEITLLRLCKLQCIVHSKE